METNELILQSTQLAYLLVPQLVVVARRICVWLILYTRGAPYNIGDATDVGKGQGWVFPFKIEYMKQSHEYALV